MDPEDFDGYDDDPNPYEGTYAEENGDFDETFVEEDGDEPSDEEVAEWEAQEDAGLDAAWEDRFETDY